MMSATMSDDLNIPFTVVQQVDQESVRDEDKQQQWETLYSEKKVVIQVQNIKLIQAPSETLSIRIEIASERDAYSGNGLFRMEGELNLFHHTYHVEMQFHNYLHEFNQNYKYEIICKIANSSKHLFACSMNRRGAFVKHGKQYLPLATENLLRVSKNVYFCIRRRLSGSNEVMHYEKVHRVMSTLKNIGCDVILEAKDGVIPTHKFILSQNSAIFQAMLSVKMKDKQNGVIDVSDTEKRVVNKMLDYLYTGKIGELEDMTEALFKLAHRYQLHDLCSFCEEYYTFNVKVDNDNIVKILELTDLYELKNLKKCALNFTKSHEQELIKIPGYRKYLIQSINSGNVVAMLLLSEKYGLEDVKIKCFDFVNDNYHDLMEKQDFLYLFVTNGLLMRDLHVYVHKIALDFKKGLFV